jgi:glycosyltransferase involved in cell wall biosynthesis
LKNNNTSTNLKKYKVAILVFNNFLYDSRVLREAISLKEGGYDVKVIAFHEEELPEFEYKEEIPVYRIRLKSRSWSKSYFVQIIKWIELFYRIVKNHRDADFYHVCDVLPLPVGMLIKKYFNKNAKVVYDAHELEFDKNVDRKFYGKLISFLEARYIKKVDAMMTVSEPIAKVYGEHYNITPPKVVMNCANLQNVKPNHVFRKKFNIQPEQIIVLYQGSLKPNRGVEELIKAFKTFSDKYVLVLLGIPYTNAYLDYLKNEMEKVNNIFYHPVVAPNELLSYTSSADIGTYIIQKTNRSHDMSLGNKIFEYIHAGLPVITSDLIVTREVIGNKLGFVLKEDTTDEIKKAIDTILENGFDSYKKELQIAAQEYNWENQETIMLQIYEELKG